jgi:hypothetical protein
MDHERSIEVEVNIGGELLLLGCGIDARLRNQAIGGFHGAGFAQRLR